MKKIIKTLLLRFVIWVIGIIFKTLKFLTLTKKWIYYEFLNKVYFIIINHKSEISHLDIHHEKVNMTFYTPNEVNYHSVKSFSYSEPETLDWIDSFKPNEKFIDIGGNVGFYSTYYLSKYKNGFAFIFEPSFLNLRILYKNLEINNVKNYVIFPNPLFEKSMIGEFKMTYESEGSAFSSFVIDKGYDGKKLDNSLPYFNTYGFSLDDIYNKGILDPSDSIYHVKIDVDGAEEQVLRGGFEFLKHNNVKSVLIELYLFGNYNKILKIFENMSFVLDESVLKYTEKMQIEYAQKGLTHKELKPTVLNHLFVKK